MTSLVALDHALAHAQWDIADDVTCELMCSLVGTQVPVTPQVIAKLADDDLRRIDDLWAQHSTGDFGFRAQARIWLALGGPPKIFDFSQMSQADRLALAGYERRFAREVGWAESSTAREGHERSRWVGCSYDRSTMRRGALPYRPLMCSYGFGLVGLIAAAVANRYRRNFETERGSAPS